jgi:hypothetical protein
VVIESELANLQWRKSSHSADNGSCVEATHLTEAIAVRDSKLLTTGDFPHLLLTPTDWAGLLGGIHSGHLT